MLSLVCDVVQSDQIYYFYCLINSRNYKVVETVVQRHRADLPTSTSACNLKFLTAAGINFQFLWTPRQTLLINWPTTVTQLSKPNIIMNKCFQLKHELLLVEVNFKKIEVDWLKTVGFLLFVSPQRGLKGCDLKQLNCSPDWLTKTKHNLKLIQESNLNNLHPIIPTTIGLLPNDKLI